MIAKVTTNGFASPGTCASSYLDAGLSVISIRADGTKAPAMGSWLPYQKQLPTQDEINRWFLADNVGIAVIHGEVSGNSELIDIDTADVFEPYCSEVERLAPGLIDRLTVIRTPRPGYHLVYRCETIQGNQKLAQDADGKTLIETRGQGGYALAPGSPGQCHETGRTYDHYSGPEMTDLPTITPAERSILFRVAASFSELVTEAPPVQQETTFRGTGTSPGDDFNQRAQWVEILTPHGWMTDHASGDRAYWRRPDKSKGWSATTGIKSASGNDLFCVFSTNAHPFEGGIPPAACSTYSKFAAYALLNHSGDFKAAAKQLSADGYGDRVRQVEDLGPVPANCPEPPQERSRKPVEKFNLTNLVAKYPVLAPPVIDGLLREGETANLVSVSKIGKSWGVYGLAISIVMGWDWLGRFPTSQGKVLLIDNELHRSTLAHRIPKVGAAMGEARGDFFAADQYGDDFDIWPLRGKLRTLEELRVEFDKIERGYYKLIIFDAKYRFGLPGTSENDNAAETQIYNLLDQYADKLNAAMILVHHSSKGDQSGKRVTDVGSGAGAQSRAADCHMVLREHEEPGVMVLDAAVRSFPPVEPLALKWQFPLWLPADVDPTALAGMKTKQEERQTQNDHDGMRDIITELLTGPATASKLRKATGFGPKRVDRLTAMLIKDNQITSVGATTHGNKTVEYSIVNDTE